MVHLTLLRHGESEGNLAGRIQGQLDYPLTQHGEEQAQRIAAFWKSMGVFFDLVISSPLLRASRTAEIIADTLQVPIQYEPKWMERNFGSLQGELLDDINQRVPQVDFFHPYEHIGGSGESQLELYLRACQALQDILCSPAGSYLVVSHGGILNKAFFAIMGITPQGHYHSPIFHFGNTGYAQFRYNSSSRQWAVLNLNNLPLNGTTEDQQLWKND